MVSSEPSSVSPSLPCPPLLLQPSCKSLYLSCRTPAPWPGMESRTVCSFLSALFWCVVMVQVYPFVLEVESFSLPGHFNDRLLHSVD